MHCKSLCIKASAKCINVNVNVIQSIMCSIPALELFSALLRTSKETKTNGHNKDRSHMHTHPLRQAMGFLRRSLHDLWWRYINTKTRISGYYKNKIFGHFLLSLFFTWLQVRMYNTWWIIGKLHLNRFQINRSMCGGPLPAHMHLYYLLRTLAMCWLYCSNKHTVGLVFSETNTLNKCGVVKKKMKFIYTNCSKFGVVSFYLHLLIMNCFYNLK